MNRSLARFLDDLDRRDEERRKDSKKPIERSLSVNEIKLNRLSLRDFQGGTVTFEPKGKDADVYGMNTSGKTRLLSAFTWLLFNKDALGRSDFELKNLDATGQAVHGLEHTVEAELEIEGD